MRTRVRLSRHALAGKVAETIRDLGAGAGAAPPGPVRGVAATDQRCAVTAAGSRSWAATARAMSSTISSNGTWATLITRL